MTGRDVGVCNCRIPLGANGDTYRKVLEDICALCLNNSDERILSAFEAIVSGLLCAADTEGDIFPRNGTIFDAISCIHTDAIIAGVCQNIEDINMGQRFTTYPALIAESLSASEPISDEWLKEVRNAYFRKDDNDVGYVALRAECTDTEILDHGEDVESLAEDRIFGNRTITAFTFAAARVIVLSDIYSTPPIPKVQRFAVVSVRPLDTKAIERLSLNEENISCIPRFSTICHVTVRGTIKCLRHANSTFCEHTKLIKENFVEDDNEFDTGML